jgi:hypothetical protein
MPRVPLIVIPPEALYELLLEEPVPIPISYEEWLQRVTEAGMLRVALADEYGTVGIGALLEWSASKDDLSAGGVKRTRSA